MTNVRVEGLERAPGQGKLVSENHPPTHAWCAPSSPRDARRAETDRATASQGGKPAGRGQRRRSRISGPPGDPRP